MLKYVVILFVVFWTEAESATEVGFSARLSQSMNNAAVGSVIKFDTVITNEGNGYDPATGIFTVPNIGMYLFNVFVTSSGYGSNVVLKINGVEMMYAFSDDDDSAGNALVKVLNVGDTVWVETYKDDLQSIGANYTTFSGVKF